MCLCDKLSAELYDEITLEETFSCRRLLEKAPQLFTLPVDPPIAAYSEQEGLGR